MSRYIDADVLIDDLIHNRSFYPALVASAIKNTPTADVVDVKVVSKIFEEIEKEIEEALKSNYKVLLQFENSNELYNSVRGKIDALLGIERFIAELKKKYLEGENDGN